MRLVAAFLLLLVGSVGAGAASDPCAKYSDADDYNYCLAAAGPVARHRASSPAPSPEFRRHSRTAPVARVSAKSFASRSFPAKPFPPGMFQKPAPKGRVRFQIFSR